VSQTGDVVGLVKTYLHAQVDAKIAVNQANAHLSVSVYANEDWFGDFQAMYSLDKLEAGYYGNLQLYPNHNPAKGALSWFGFERACSTAKAWFVVDSVSYDGATLTTIDLRFGQHCGGDVRAIYGKIHWDVQDDTSPPGPVVPPPMTRRP
jgi:hypothetical protein